MQHKQYGRNIRSHFSDQPRVYSIQTLNVAHFQFAGVHFHRVLYCRKVLEYIVKADNLVTSVSQLSLLTRE